MLLESVVLGVDQDLTAGPVEYHRELYNYKYAPVQPIRFVRDVIQHFERGGLNGRCCRSLGSLEGKDRGDGERERGSGGVGFGCRQHHRPRHTGS